MNTSGDWQRSYHDHLLHVRHSRFGRGVFTRQDLRAGCEIARCPAILIPTNDLQSDTLAAYVFEWNTPDYYALLGGVGSFFNHSGMANAQFSCCEADTSMVFTASQDIAAQQEILINYDYSDEYAQVQPALAWFRNLHKQ